MVIKNIIIQTSRKVIKLPPSDNTNIAQKLQYYRKISSRTGNTSRRISITITSPFSKDLRGCYRSIGSKRQYFTFLSLRKNRRYSTI